MKKLLSFSLACLLALSLFVLPASAADAGGIHVLLDGQELFFDVPPAAINQRTMVPFRAIFEALGYTVSSDSAARTVSAVSAAHSISMPLDCAEMTVDGKTVALDVAPVVVSNRTLIPVRAVSEASGCDVLWDGVGQTVLIYHRRGTLDRGSPFSKGMADDGTYIYTGNYEKQCTVRIDPATLDVSFSNMLNSNYYDYQDGKLYGFLSDGYSSYDVSSGQLRKLTDWIFDPTLAGDFIYFNGPTYAPADAGSDQFGLFRIPIGGGPWQRVSNQPVKFGFVYQDELLLNDGGEIYSAKDGSLVTSLSSGVTEAGTEDFVPYAGTAVYGDWYYVAYNAYRSEREGLTPRGILAYNYKTGERRFLPCDKVIDGIEVTENSIFIMADEGKNFDSTYALYRMTLDGTHPIRLWRDADTSNYTFQNDLTALGNYLYFRHGVMDSQGNSATTFSRVPMAGGAEEVIFTEH